MTREIIAAALESEGLKAQSGQSYAIPEEREATCLVSAPGEVFSVPKVAHIDLREKYLYLQTSKDEHYFFAYEDVLGLRLLGSKATSAKERSAGFSR
jgi:hypothetical protein